MKSLAQELLSFIDLTTLNATDTVQSVNTLVDFALHNERQGDAVAAICVYPNFGEQVLQRLSNSSMKTAVVAGSFPHGQSFLEVKEQEVRLAAELGVHEIDIVLNRGLFFAANYKGVKEEIVRLKRAAGKAHLKVILETGELKSKENIRLAARLAIEAGADFVKTSTGKCEIGATFDSVRIICQELKGYYIETSNKVGFKASGGIRTFEDAAMYRDIVLAELGEDWLTPDLFRIGASSLANDLLNIIHP